jgi:peptidoglycan/xylan/chitin deacetylase (PgdA/CDA1 family)
MKTCFLSIDVEPLTALSCETFNEEVKFEPIKKLGGILDILKKYKAHATLFSTGETLEHYPDSVKKWSEDFEIGCHNYYHVELDKVDLLGREKQIKDFIKIYADIFKQGPLGFRAPRNIIDNEHFEILERYGFLYDSSVLPRYPLGIRHYKGYRGRGLILPYYPDKSNYLKKGEAKILEIPESPVALSVPLVGTWLRKLGVRFFKFLFVFKKPDFISLSMHSWDGIEFSGAGSKNSGKIFLQQLDEIMGFLKNLGYEFKSGKQIYEEFSKNK